jgi:cell division cycle 14
MAKVDDRMVYTPFKNDHGPLNLAMTFEALLAIHSHINVCVRGYGYHTDTKQMDVNRPVCLYTSSNPQTKSNIALVAALFTVRSPPDTARYVMLLPLEPQGAFLGAARTDLHSSWSTTETPGVLTSPSRTLSSFPSATLATGSTSTPSVSR